MKHGLYRMLD